MRVLSAMQPSGMLHIGNYFGSMRPNIAYQDTADEVLYFVVDLHALTTIRDPAMLQRYRREIVLDCLACGFDPERSIFFYQSQVPEHTELLWILSTVTPMGLLERAVSYKEKVEKGIAASAGLFTYPVLMAADILLYNADTVPVGKDQKQHVEIARDIALKFNAEYGEIFVLPEPLVSDAVAVVPGIDGQKMSKSYGNIIPLFCDEFQARRIIQSIVTDSRGAHDPKDPEKCVLFHIHRLFLDPQETEDLAAAYRNGLSYSDAKKQLFQRYSEYFAPMRERRAALERRSGYIEEVMHHGLQKALSIACPMMERVRSAVGLV